MEMVKILMMKELPAGLPANLPQLQRSQAFQGSLKPAQNQLASPMVRFGAAEDDEDTPKKDESLVPPQAKKLFSKGLRFLQQGLGELARQLDGNDAVKAPEPEADTPDTNPQQTQQFFTALQAGDIATLEQLKAAGLNVNARNSKKQTALMLQATEANLPVLEWLLANGADAMLTDNKGRTALMLTLQTNKNLANRLEVVKRLAAATTDWSVRSRRIVEEGILTDTVKQEDESVLEMAVARKQTAELQAMAAAGAKCDEDYALFQAVAAKDEASLDALLAMQPNVTRPADKKAQKLGFDGQLIHLAADKGLVGILNKLKAAGADINAPSAKGTPLIRSAAKAHLEAVNALLDLGADIDARFPNTIYTAEDVARKALLKVDANKLDQMARVLAVVERLEQARFQRTGSPPPTPSLPPQPTPTPPPVTTTPPPVTTTPPTNPNLTDDLLNIVDDEDPSA
jgi:ankyrin repeat protein